MCWFPAQRSRLEAGLVETERLEDAPLQLTGQIGSRRFLDDELEDEVVRARVGEATRRSLLIFERELDEVPRLPGGIGGAREVVDVVREARGVGEELPDRDPFTAGQKAGQPPLGVVVEAEGALVDQLEDDGSHEGLRHAADAEAVARPQRATRLAVGEAARCALRAGFVADKDEGTRRTCCNDAVERFPKPRAGLVAPAPGQRESRAHQDAFNGIRGRRVSKAFRARAAPRRAAPCPSVSA
jgi:hypothetical protein